MACETFMNMARSGHKLLWLLWVFIWIDIMALPIQIMGIARVCKGSVAVIVGARETTPYLGENSVRMWLHACKCRVTRASFMI